ncbi:MAG: hypothetical protein R3F43_16460 [bacterium]
MAHVGEAVAAAGVEKIRMVQRPIRLEGVGRGVVGWRRSGTTPSAWRRWKTWSPGRRWIPKPFRRIAQELMDACAVEQDLLCGIILQGGARSPGREAIDVGILCGSVARGLGLSAIECVELTEAVAHGAGRAYPNPAPRVFTEAEAMGVLALRQLQDCYRVTAPLAHRVAVSLEHAIGPQGVGPRTWRGRRIRACRRSSSPSPARGWPGARRRRHAGDLAAGRPPSRCSSGRRPRWMRAGPALRRHGGPLRDAGRALQRGRGGGGRHHRPPARAARSIGSARPRVRAADDLGRGMRTAEGRVVPERRARIALGADNGRAAPGWCCAPSIRRPTETSLIMRALVRRPATVVAQMGLR